jgi:hypothetical protein
MNKIPVYVINDSKEKAALSIEHFNHPRFQVEILDNKFGNEWIKRIISIASMRVDSTPIIIAGTDKLLMNKSQKELLDVIDNAIDHPDFWDIINLGVANDDCKLYHNCITIDGSKFCRSQGMPLALLVSSKAIGNLSKSFRENLTVQEMKVTTIYPNIFDFDISRAEADEFVMANKCLIPPVRDDKPREINNIDENNQNNSTGWWILILIVLVIIIAVLYLYNKNRPQKTK